MIKPAWLFLAELGNVFQINWAFPYISLCLYKVLRQCLLHETKLGGILFLFGMFDGICYCRVVSPGGLWSLLVHRSTQKAESGPSNLDQTVWPLLTMTQFFFVPLPIWLLPWSICLYGWRRNHMQIENSFESKLLSGLSELALTPIWYSFEISSPLNWSCKKHVNKPSN